MEGVDYYLGKARLLPNGRSGTPHGRAGLPPDIRARLLTSEGLEFSLGRSEILSGK
jgi:hypothetical protein